MTDAELDPLRRLRHALETAENNGSLPGDAEKAVDRMSELLPRWETTNAQGGRPIPEPELLPEDREKWEEEEPPPQTPPLPLPSFDED